MFYRSLYKSIIHLPDGTYSNNGHELKFNYGYHVALLDNTSYTYQSIPNIGVWTDDNGNKLIETSIHIDDLNRALQIGKNENQKYIWDCRNNRLIEIKY